MNREQQFATKKKNNKIATYRILWVNRNYREDSKKKMSSRVLCMCGKWEKLAYF